MFIPLLTAAYGLIRSCENRARASSANRGKAAILRIMESTMPYRGLFASRAFSIKRLCHGRELSWISHDRDREFAAHLDQSEAATESSRSLPRASYAE
jgi:hypothetical protein